MNAPQPAAETAHPAHVVEPTHPLEDSAHIDASGRCACDCARCTTRLPNGEIDECICADCVGQPDCVIHTWPVTE